MSGPSKPGDPLTARQAAVLDFIRSYIEAHSFPPSLREIGNHMGIRSTNGVNDHLHALERKGRIRRSSLLSRSIVLTEPSTSLSIVDFDPARIMNAAINTLYAASMSDANASLIRATIQSAQDRLVQLESSLSRSAQ